MIIDETKLENLDDERIDNNIDRIDVIHFVTMYGLQDKVSHEENLIVTEFVRKIQDIENKTDF